MTSEKRENRDAFDRVMDSIADTAGFVGGALLLVTLAHQLDFLALPKSLFAYLFYPGIALVSLAAAQVTVHHEKSADRS